MAQSTVLVVHGVSNRDLAAFRREVQKFGDAVGEPGLERAAVCWDDLAPADLVCVRAGELPAPDVKAALATAIGSAGGIDTLVTFGSRVSLFAELHGLRTATDTPPSLASGSG